MTMYEICLKCPHSVSHPTKLVSLYCDKMELNVINIKKYPHGGWTCPSHFTIPYAGTDALSKCINPQFKLIAKLEKV